LSEHLTQIQIEDYGRHTLSAAEFLSASRHMRDCEACRLKVERALDNDEAFYGLKSEVLGASLETVISTAKQAHLTFERTAAYVDQILAAEELQAVKDHLAGCEQCAVAVKDLRDFRNQGAPGLDRECQPPSASPAPVANENRWRRFVTAMSSPLRRSPALVASYALAALLMIAAGWLIWRAIERNDKDQKITRTTPSTTAPVVTPGVSPVPTQEVAAVIAQLNDGGGQVALNADGKLSGIERLSPGYEQMIRGALSSERLEKSPFLAGLVRPDGSLRKGGDNQGGRFSVIAPAGVVLLSDRPIFRWAPLEGATNYVVKVYDDKLNKIIISPQLTNTSWTAPQSLKRGGIYSWEVTTIKGGEEFVSPRPPAPSAKFRIIDAAMASEIFQARRDYASSHLTLALLYTKAGLLDKAEQELRALQKANLNSTIPRRLLANIKAMRR
jgi:anti-sigma factor RsiW